MIAKIKCLWDRVSVWLWVAAGLVLVGVTLAFRRRPAPAKPPVNLAPSVRRALDATADAARTQAQQHAERAERILKSSGDDLEHVLELSDVELIEESRAYARRKRATPPILALLFALSLASAVRAEALPEPESMAHPDTGSKGVWLPWDVHQFLIADVRELASLQAAVPELRAARDAAFRESDSMRIVVSVERANADALSLRLVETQEEVARANRWYRSPRFLVPLSLMAGAVLGAWIFAEVAQ